MIHPLKVIIAEDEPDLQRYYRAIVSRMGHEVVTVVGTGDELAEEIEQKRPDLVITDINMPGMSGLEVIEQDETGTQFLVISAAETAASKNGSNGKVVARLTKPVDMAAIKTAIEKAATHATE